MLAFFFKLAQSQDNCRVYMSCLECFEDPDCGWCQDRSLCVEGNSTGPAHGECEWYYYTCPTERPSSPTTTKSPSSPTTTRSPSSTPAPSAAPQHLEWATVGTYLSTSSNGTVVTRTSTVDSWTTAWINSTMCSSGIYNSTIEVVFYFDDPDNLYNAVMGLVSQSCAESYTGYNIDEIIGWFGYGGCGGWSYISENGQTLADNTVSTYGVTWMKQGTKVTMVADLDEGTLGWYVDGQFQGQAFTDVTTDTNYYIGVSIIAPTTSFKIISSSCEPSETKRRKTKVVD